MPAWGPGRMPHAQCGHRPAVSLAPMAPGPCAHRAAQPTLQSAYWYCTQAFFLLTSLRTCKSLHTFQANEQWDLQIYRYVSVYQDTKPVRLKSLITRARYIFLIIIIFTFWKGRQMNMHVPQHYLFITVRVHRLSKECLLLVSYVNTISIENVHWNQKECSSELVMQIF